MFVPPPRFVLLPTAWDAWVFTGVLVLGLPCFAYFCLFKGSQGQGFLSRLSKAGIYLVIAASLWTMLLLLTIVAYRHGLTAEDLGLHWHRPLRTALITAGLVLVLIVLSSLQFWKNLQMPKGEMRAQLSKLRQFFPSRRLEIVAFCAMAISAGICEEILYRGWLLGFVGAVTGSVWIALVLSSIGFGLGHAYQGASGVVSNGAVGLLLGLAFMWIGSLVPVQILHAFINLSSGLMCAYFLTRMDADGTPMPSAVVA